MGKVLSVDEHLANVDYGYDIDYVPSQFSIHFINFITLMTDGKGESSPTPNFHYHMLDNFATPVDRIANLASRGTSKTSVFAEIMFFYIGVYQGVTGFGDIDAILYVSDTIENGVRSLKQNMEYRYKGSKFLKKYIPKVIFNQTEIWLTNANGHITGIKMFGAATGLRGTKIKAKRPQLAVLDDLLSDKNAKSDGIIENIENTIYKGVNHALDPTHRKIVFSGTPFHAGDPLYKAIESGAWLSNVYPICEKFPCNPEEFKGAWPERFTYDFIKKEYDSAKAEGKLDAFYQELMLQITSTEDRLVQDVDIQWFNRSDVFSNKDGYSIFITTDFATSLAKSADYSVISIWAKNSSDHYFLLDGMIQRQTSDQNLDSLFFYAHKYKPDSVGIEINGQQAGVIPWIQQEMVRRDTFFALAKTIGTNGKPSRVGILTPNTSNKLDRFNVVLPTLKQGRVWFPKELSETPFMDEVIKELKSVTRKGIRSKHDDWLDTFSMLGLMETWSPMHTEKIVKDDKDVEYTKYWAKFDDTEESDTESYYV